MTTILRLRTILIAVSFTFFVSNAYSQDSLTDYPVYYVDQGAINIDGNISSDEWKNTQLIESAFHFPWRSEKAPSTKFKAAWNEDGFYFSFDVTDNNIVLADGDKGEKSVDHSDRVEIFLDPTPTDQQKPTLANYYGLEMAPNNVIHEYSAQLYRKFNSDWSLDNAHYETQINDNGYMVEGFIPTNSLSALGISVKEGSSVFAGFFRAEFLDEFGIIQRRWISWVNPKTEKPDFHLPSAFGLMKFIKKEN